MAVFEYRPFYKVTKPLSADEMAKLSGKPLSTIKKRISHQKLKALKKTKKYSPEDCMAILNCKTDIKNWYIEGYYSQTQIADMLKISKASVYNITKRLDLPCIKQYTKEGCVWFSEESVAKIKSNLDYSEMDDVNVENFVTTGMIAESCGVQRQYVNSYARIYKIPKVKKHSKNFYTKENADKLIALIEKAKGKNARQNIFTDEKLEELKRKHPLVKDVRCFDPDYWVDPLPLCFQGIDDDF